MQFVKCHWLNSCNIDTLKDIKKEFCQKINTILQIRLHPSINALKNKVEVEGKKGGRLTYITSRDNWYVISWKGDERK